MTANALLDTVPGEIAFFRALMRARPVGIHRHFHLLAIRNAILRDTGQRVPPAAIWAKLRACYDLDALDALEADGYDSPPSSGSTPRAPASPPPAQSLAAHPFFRAEFALPCDAALDALLAARRIRASPSPPSSPASSPAPAPARPRARPSTRGRSTLGMAGLVGGDSDSSALTQESGDDAGASGTDAGTDYADDDGAPREHSPASSRTPRARLPTKRGAAVAGRTRAAAGGSTRGWKKKKK